MRAPIVVGTLSAHTHNSNERRRTTASVHTQIPLPRNQIQTPTRFDAQTTIGVAYILSSLKLDSDPHITCVRCRSPMLALSCLPNQDCYQWREVVWGGHAAETVMTISTLYADSHEQGEGRWDLVTQSSYTSHINQPCPHRKRGFDRKPEAVSRNPLLEVFSDEDRSSACHTGDTVGHCGGRIIILWIQREPTRSVYDEYRIRHDHIQEYLGNNKYCNVSGSDEYLSHGSTRNLRPLSGLPDAWTLLR